MFVRLLIVLGGLAFLWWHFNRGRRMDRGPVLIATRCVKWLENGDIHVAKSFPMPSSQLAQWPKPDLEALQAHLRKHGDSEGLFWLHWIMADRFGQAHGTPNDALPDECPAITLTTARFILQCEPSITQPDITSRYRRLMQYSHPDQGGHTVLSIALNEARRLLADAPS